MLIEEGLVKLEIPEAHFGKGPGARTAGFYNVSQKLNRDLTLVLLNTIKPKLILDGFGGTGVRALRIAKEIGLNVVLSEINKKSYEYILSNQKLNNTFFESYNEGFENIADRYLFDFIDVDPYGTIIPFVDKAITSIRNGGLIAVTATDLSSLSGSLPKKTFRRYGAKIMNDRFRHEMGVRLLISYVIRRAAAFDKGATPVLSFWHSHYYRVFFRIKSGSKQADLSLENVGYINKSKLVSPIYPDIEEGPIWLSNLSDNRILSNLTIPEHLKDDRLLGKYLSLLKNEDISVLFVELSDLASHYHTDIPSFKTIFESLKKRSDINFGRTHFSDTGLKISYDSKVVEEIMLNAHA